MTICPTQPARHKAVSSSLEFCYLPSPIPPSSRSLLLETPTSQLPMEAGEPQIIRDKDQMRRWSRAMRSQGKTVGLVPTTMGYLHDGHVSLIREARTHADVLAVSIYVNKGQSPPREDLSTYPSAFHGDIRKLTQIPGGVDVVFNPHNLYDYGNNTDAKAPASNGARASDGGETVSCVEEKGAGHETSVRVERLEKGMCGRSRPVFFRGVATVVSKLFNIVEPDVAVFGKQDYQQWRIIQRMVRDLDFSIRVIGSEIVRENDGLAMGSRNVRLSPEEREKARCISKSLSKARSSAEKGQINCKELRDLVVEAISEAGGSVDYAEVSFVGSLESVEEIRRSVVLCVAAWFGLVRPIDNMEINK
nr:LOW QUALITY PROTEIN: pantoate--beta-alanine ligase [Malus domestica]